MPVINFHRPLDPIVQIAIGHSPAKFVEHQLCGAPLNPQHLSQPQGRDAALVDRHQVNRKKPLVERQAGVLEQRSGRRRRLPTAGPAFADAMPFQNPGLAVTAFRTREAILLAVAGHFIQALLRSADPFVPCCQFHRLLLHQTFAPQRSFMLNNYT